MAKVLVAGCGFVGLAAARLFHEREFEVIGLTRSPETAAQLKNEPFRVVPCDITDPSALASVSQAEPQIVIHCASSGRGGVNEYRQTYLEGTRNLTNVLRPGHLIFVGSTSVYAQTTGDWVTEESAAEPQRETGRILLEAETLVLSQGGTIARLGGIYGPGRSVLLQRFFSGAAAIEEDGRRWINQAHRDDIAAALGTMAEKNARGIFNVADDQPLEQRVLYQWLASRFKRPLPRGGPIDPNRKRGWTNKRVSNAKLRALGWEPRYPSFFAAVTNDPDLLRSIQV